MSCYPTKEFVCQKLAKHGVRATGVDIYGREELDTFTRRKGAQGKLVMLHASNDMWRSFAATLPRTVVVGMRPDLGFNFEIYGAEYFEMYIAEE